MGFSFYHNVHEESDHVGLDLWIQETLALACDDDDHHGHFQILSLAAGKRLSVRYVQYALRRLESSGDIRVYEWPGHDLQYEMMWLPREWPQSFLDGQLIDRRHRERWTDAHDQRRRAMGRENALRRQQKLEQRREARKTRG